MDKFIRKQPSASDDYSIARQIVDSIKKGDVELVSVDNLKAFRKYVHELGIRYGKSFTTKKQGENAIKIICLP